MVAGGGVAGMVGVCDSTCGVAGARDVDGVDVDMVAWEVLVGCLGEGEGGKGGALKGPPVLGRPVKLKSMAVPSPLWPAVIWTKPPMPSSFWVGIVAL